MGVTKVPLKILNDPFDRTPSPLFVQRLWCFWYIRFWNLFEYRWIRKTFQNPVQNLKNEEWMFWNWESFKILFPDSDRLLCRDLFRVTHIIWVIYIFNESGMLIEWNTVSEDKIQSYSHYTRLKLVLSSYSRFNFKNSQFALMLKKWIKSSTHPRKMYQKIKSYCSILNIECAYFEIEFRLNDEGSWVFVD